ncbi:MAG: RDD family protein, partial [Armatimonadetes bacterium]|nr:RDD family protein [Armatimonadota bacterium]
STVLAFELAGPGSRFAALLVDTVCQAALLAVLAVAAGAPLLLWGGWPELSAAVARWLWPLVALAAWLVFWGYYVVFETGWSGQTPGKRALGLRVVREGGEAVDFAATAQRNVLRCVDLLPLVAPYLLGAAVVTWSARGQRVGDMVAGTLVVRERRTPWIEALVAGSAGAEAARAGLAAAQLERVSEEESAVVAEFLRRRVSLPLAARRGLAEKLAGPLRERLGCPRPAEAAADADEDWLEVLQSGWSARRRRL